MQCHRSLIKEGYAPCSENLIWTNKHEKVERVYVKTVLLNNSSCFCRGCAEWPNRSRWGDRRCGWERSRGIGGEVEGERSQDSGHPAGDGEKMKSALSLQPNIPEMQTFIHSSVIHSSRWVTSLMQIWGLQRTCCSCANWTQWPQMRTWKSSFLALGP